MHYADAIRRQAEDAPRAALPAVTAALWRAFGEGHVSEAEAEALSKLIDARRVLVSGHSAGQAPNLRETNIGSFTGLLLDRQRSPKAGVGSRPRTDASLERRRRWASSGRLPPALAARFTPGEQAALSLVAAETARRGDCRMAIEHMASVAGVSRSTVKAAIREARKLGLITVEERRITGFRNDTNVVRIVSPEWTAWLRLARKGDPLSKSGSSVARKGVTVRAPLGRKGEPSRYPLGSKGIADREPLKGGGVKSSTSTPTQVSKSGKTAGTNRV
jgi:CRP-like cAMP-binding protein